MSKSLMLAAWLLLCVPLHPVLAQDDSPDDDSYPIQIETGETLPGFEPEAVLPPGECYDPLPIASGEIIYVEPGVNIRAQATPASAIVWNTVYNNRNEEGELIERPLSIEAVVLDGPVCSAGYNWWQVRISGQVGWVAEGRPTDEGGYFLIVPALLPTPTCDNPFPLEAGDEASLIYNARVRTEPNLEGRVRTVAPAGTPVLVLSGAECIDERLWYQVRVTVVNVVYEGWMAQGEEGVLWLLPPDFPSLEAGTLCNAPLPFAPGERGYVRSVEETPHNLRTAPGTDAPLLYTLVDGVPFIIRGGPICRENLNWWFVEVLANRPVFGWIAEGSSGVGYWLSPLEPDDSQPVIIIDDDED